MKHKPNLLCPVMLVLGLIGCGLYRGTYTHLDQARILVRGSVPEILLWILTACAPAVAFLGRKAKLGAPYPPIAAVGDISFALGCFTLLQFHAKGPAILEIAYQAISAVAIVCLLIMAGIHFLDKEPHFILHLGPCLLTLVQLVECYQLWSEKPLILDYFFGLGGALCLALFAYHRMAQAAKLPNSRVYPFVCLLGIFFCSVAVMQTEFPIFFSSGVVWLLASATALEE